MYTQIKNTSLSNESLIPMSLTIFVTGASSGFGFCISEYFAKQGHRVIAAARRLALIHELQERYPEQILAVELDVRDQDAVQTRIQNLPTEWQAIDVLVNNAGLAAGLEPAQRADLNDWQQMIDTNINGLVYVTHAMLPKMLARNSGLIINVGSVAGHYPYPGGSVYGASKAFVHQFSLNLRADLAGSNVRVTCLAPGLCSDTEFSVVRFKGDVQKAAAVYENVEAIKPNDIAQTVYWLSTLPAHLNINYLEMMPTCQGFSPFNIVRKE